MLTVNQASVYFETHREPCVHAIDRVSLEIPEKGFVVALGASGCGKSTLLHAMAGFLPLSEGTITLNGRLIEAPGADRGVVFQKDSLLPWLNVLDNVALGLKFAGLSRKARQEKSFELLHMVGLERFASASPYELSGGMRQRVGLARALAPNPDILLMDEPFGALDSLTRQQMQGFLTSVWKKTAKQIFFITHSIEEALLMGTRVVVMSPRPGRVLLTRELTFVDALSLGVNVNEIKSDRSFIDLSSDITSLIHESNENKL